MRARWRGAALLAAAACWSVLAVPGFEAGAADTPFSVKVNFQPASAAVPAGHVADGGSAYGDRGGGLTFGWDTANSGNARDRNAPNSPDQRHDTLNHLQVGGANRLWEMAVPNGQYTVRVVAGDPSYSNSVYRLNVEGALTVDGTPTSTNPWNEGTATVAVADGRLTVTNAAGASNNKINFVEITAASGTPPPPPPPPPPPSGFTTKVNFQPAAAPRPEGYLVDAGDAYGPRPSGLSYGWAAHNTGYSRDRNAANSTDQRYDTLNHIHSGASTWEVAVPNGQYTVRVVAGDPWYVNSIYRINVEGSLIVNGTPTTAARWIEGSGTVTVGDGRLTVTNAAGASNNKINFIEITTSGSPATTVSPALTSPDDRLGLGSRLVFSTVNEEPRPAKTVTVRNPGSQAFTVTGLTLSGPQSSLFRLASGQATSFSVPAGGSAPVSVEFRPLSQNLVENYATLTIATSAGNMSVGLAGLDALNYEGTSEPNLATITRVLGYSTNIGPLGSTPSPSGDEVLSAHWRAADTSRPVQLFPMAAYSGRRTTESGATGWYPAGTTTRSKLFGIPGGSDASGGQNQRLLPEINSGGTTSFTPGGPFGLFSENDWSDDTRNGTAQVHNFRFYPAKGAGGSTIPDTWLVGWDYADTTHTGKNYDYQDGVYLLVNARPA